MFLATLAYQTMSARLATKSMRLLSFILSFIGIVSSLGLPYTTSISGTDYDTTTAMCNQLASQLPGQISYPASSIYTTSLSTYYSAQERALIPGCIFTPTSTADVSLFIKLMTAGNDASIPDFAIRSGGHKYFAGAANVAGGITVDMRGMHNVSFNSDASVASIGAGAIWSSDVYEYLVPRNLTAAGARLPGIGIGGFVLGGNHPSSPFPFIHKPPQAIYLTPLPLSLSRRHNIPSPPQRLVLRHSPRLRNRPRIRRHRLRNTHLAIP